MPLLRFNRILMEIQLYGPLDSIREVALIRSLVQAELVN